MTLGGTAHQPQTSIGFPVIIHHVVYAKAMKPWLLDSDTISVPAGFSVNSLLGRDLLRFLLVCNFKRFASSASEAGQGKFACRASDAKSYT